MADLIKLETNAANENPPFCEPGPDGTCSICGDEALPGRVIELLGDNMAAVQMGGSLVEVAIDLVDNVQVGDTLLVHLGFAIATVESESVL